MTARNVVIPDVGEGGMDVVFVQWYVSEGDFVNEGDELFELDTAKANVSVQASESGYVVSLAASPDDEVERGQVVAQIADSVDEVPSTPADEAPEAESGDSTGETPREPWEGQPHSTLDDSPRTAVADTNASPKAKRLARELGVDLGSLAGEGMITADVVQAAHDERATGSRDPVPNDEIDSSLIRVARQRVMATSAMASWLQSPHASLSMSVERQPPAARYSLDDIVAAAATALSAVEAVNVRWDGQSAVHRSGLSLGLLWKTPSGLILTRIDGRSQARDEHSVAIRSARDRAERGVLLPEDHDERSLTVMWIDADSPMTGTSILPHGDSAMITAISSPRGLGITLTVDHRCIDLSIAARFLDSVASSLKEQQ